MSNPVAATAAAVAAPTTTIIKTSAKKVVNFADVYVVIESYRIVFHCQSLATNVEQRQQHKLVSIYIEKNK